MKLKSQPGENPSKPAGLDAERRSIGALLTGVANYQDQFDVTAYQAFRNAIFRTSLNLAEPQTEQALLHEVNAAVQQFQVCHESNTTALKAREKEWRQLTGQLLHLLALRDHIDEKSEAWSKICVEQMKAATAGEIHELRTSVLALFERTEAEAVARQTAFLEEQDRSTANDNAAGLLGGGAAIQHVRTMLAESRPGFVGLFRLSCLDVVGERFGPEGIQDCLMAVSAFLIESLRREDVIYHWSESSLLVVCDRKVREDILAAELNRVLARNRDFTIKIGQRLIMLRIPIDLKLIPISEIGSADNLHDLLTDRTASALHVGSLGSTPAGGAHASGTHAGA
jgi:GGDEF domain-containing protein